MKKRSLLRKNIVRLSILGLGILLGTGLASGIQLYTEMMEDYQEFAFSFLTQAVENIYGYMVGTIIQRADSFDPYAWEKAPPQEALDENAVMTNIVYSYWREMQDHFSYTQTLNASILRCYLVVPTEEDVVYICDASDTEQHRPFEHRDYYPEEKENLMQIMTGEQDNLSTYYRRKELIFTVMRGICDQDDRVTAVVGIDISMSDIQSAFRKMMINLAVILFLIMAAACLAYYVVLQRSVIRPLLSMEQKTKGLVQRLKSGSDEPLQMNVHTGDEIENLAKELENMGENLAVYIRESREAAVEKERTESEMRLAGSIQAHMLPDLAAYLRDHREIELSASMSPADAVGGDFYDCFSIDQDHTAFVMADVSGNGVPAALFMALTRTLIRCYANETVSPADILTKVNRQICSSNKDKMFVTVWMGILNPAAGVLTVCNAGHEYPVIKKPDGDWTLLKDQHSFLIGIRDGIIYNEYELQLEKGSMLFVYTDGVTEAMNTASELFGAERMLDTLNSADCQNPEMVLDGIKTAVFDFARDSGHQDDITMMCIRIPGNSD